MTKRELEFYYNLYREYIKLLDNGDMILAALDRHTLYDD